jgi:DNA modification methylase
MRIEFEAVLSDRARWAAVKGDSLALMSELPDASVDAVGCDPPSGIDFMGKDWDCFRRAHNDADVQRANVFGRTSRTSPHSYGESERENFIAFIESIMRQCLRVLKPGGHALVWALPRTSHWTAMGIENAGFEIRDSIHHLFLNGFPKYLDLAKGFDKANGVAPLRSEPPSLGMATGPNADQWNALHQHLIMPPPTSDEAKKWAGWATALKPAHEVWWLVRKPLIGTVVENVRAHGVGALHTDSCDHCGFDAYWPTNVVMSHGPECGEVCQEGCPVAMIEAQREGGSKTFPVFHYFPKPSPSEKNAGCEGLPVLTPEDMTGRKTGSAGLVMTHDDGSPKANAYAGTSGKARENHHPTVKSIALMRWLLKLITPPNGVVLDPFMGSGTTGCGAVLEGFRFLGIDKDADGKGNPLGYVRISRARLRHYSATGAAPLMDVDPYTGAVTFTASANGGAVAELVVRQGTFTREAAMMSAALEGF